MTRTDMRKIRIQNIEGILPKLSGITQISGDNREKNIIYTGNIQDFVENLSHVKYSDLLIEEPSLDEIFMHYYQDEGEDKKGAVK